MMTAEIIRRILFSSLIVWAAATLAIRSGDAECSDENEVYGTRRTMTGEPDFPSRSTRFFIAGTSTFRPATIVPTSLTGEVTTLLKNFSTLTTATEDLCGIQCLDDVLKLEIFTIASGNHFVLAPNKDASTELTLRKKAKALATLFLDLVCTSKGFGELFSNASRETILRLYPTKYLTYGKMQEILQNFFDKFDAAIEKGNDFLSTMYVVEQMYASGVHDRKKEVYFPFDELNRGSVSDETLFEWSDNVEIRKFLIHKTFLEANHSGKGEDGVAARSILKMAQRSCCMGRMNKIYESALKESAKNFVVADYPLKVTKTFIDRLTKAVEADEKLNGEWSRITKEELDETRTTKGVSKNRRINNNI